MLAAAGLLRGHAADVDEDRRIGELRGASAQPGSRREIAEALAAAKAEDVSRGSIRTRWSSAPTRCWRLAARLFDKPRKPDRSPRAACEAARAARTSCIRPWRWPRTAKFVWRTSATRATDDARFLATRSSTDYLARAGDAHLPSVGAYELEGLAASSCSSSIEGDYFTILGLPLLPLLAELATARGDCDMKRACVIGWPIAHSRSPLIHGYWLKQLRHRRQLHERCRCGRKTSQQFLRSLASAGLRRLQRHGAAQGSGVRRGRSRAKPRRRAVGAANTLWLEGRTAARAPTPIPMAS